MGFIAYDLTFLVVFTLLVALFLYTRKHNLKRDGLLYLYRTKFGIQVINWTAKKYAKILKPMQYVVIASGYILMTIVLWWIARLTWVYLTSETLAREIRVPVVTPLVPYIDKLFAVDFLPPFYFTTWIIVIAIIAIPHEFAHGIFAKLNKIRIHSTGFGFLGPFLAAFVEQDEKDMNKASKFSQLSVLAAGTFVNVLSTIFFAIVLWLFFALAFAPAGVMIGGYATASINMSEVTTVDGVPIDSFLNLDEKEDALVTLETPENTYLVPANTLEIALDRKLNLVSVYEDAPAVKNDLFGAITSVNDVPTTTYEELRMQIHNKQPGDTVTIETFDNKETSKAEVVLGDYQGQAFLGITSAPQRREVSGALSLYRLFDPRSVATFESGTHFAPVFGDLGIFIYDLLWWTVIICLSVALVNMLPVEIFDGGRFFYLTIWGLTGNENIAAKAFKASTWIILLIVLAWMVKWVTIFF